MFVDPQIHLYSSFLAVLCYYLIPHENPVVRQWLLVFFSFLLISFAAPFAGLIGIFLSVFAFIAGHSLLQRETKKFLFYAYVAVPIFVMIMFDFITSNASWLDRLGASYFAIKSITVLFDCKWRQLTPTFRQVLMLNLWFPIYSAGPIERAATFSEDKFTNRFDINDIGTGAGRILLGLFKTVYLASELISPYLASNYGTVVDVAQAGSTLGAYVFTLINFLFIYINFSGYTDVAIGTSRLFGFRITENFNFPFLATSIQNFWQRWHRSLSAVVSKYLFIPIVRATGKPALAIFLAFTIIGLWHEFTILYLIWGVLHGSALSLNMQYVKFTKRRPKLVALHKTRASKLVFGCITLTYVSWVSIIANCPSFEIAFSLTLIMLGLK